MESNSRRALALYVLTCAALASAMGCRQKCREEWDRLTHAETAQIERTRAEQFSECVVDNHIRLAYGVKDPTTGLALSDAEMAKHRGPVRVEVELGPAWRREHLVWTARSMESVWPLFRE